MGTIHVPTLLEGILEATAAEAAAKARITTLRASLEDEARRRFAAEGAAPSWTTPQLGRVRFDPAGAWTATVADNDALASYVAEHYPTEATVAIHVNASDAEDALQALTFIGVDPVETPRVEVRSAWLDKWLEGLAVDVTEERDDNAQVTRTVVAQDPARLIPVPGIGVTRAEAKLVVSLDRDRRTAAITEARTTAAALVEAAAGDDDDPVDLVELDRRRVELEGLHGDTLATIAQGHGLGRSGTKAALAERIARAEQATGHIIRPASTLPAGQPIHIAEDTPAGTVGVGPLPEGTEVEEVTTLPAAEPEPGTPDNPIVVPVDDFVARAIVDQPVEEVPDGGDVAAALEGPVKDPLNAVNVFLANTIDQPAEADLVEDLGSRETLRQLAKRLNVPAAGTKRDVAERLVAAGHTATTLKELPA